MDKWTINPDDLWAFARILKGHTFHTLYRKKPFTIEVKTNQITYIYDKTPRHYSKEVFERLCGKFNDTNSFKPKDYKGKGPDFEDAENISCTLALIFKYLGL